MKRTFFLLATSLLCILSFAQQTNSDTIDIGRKDILLFQFIDPDVEFLELGNGIENFYESPHLVGAISRWRGYGPEYIYKIFEFTRGADTMIIEMDCSQEENFNFKNMKFQKGNYVIRLEDPYYHQTIGDSVTNDTYLLNLIVKNSLRNPLGDDGVSFKSLVFFEIDMLDAKNVKWREATKEDLRILFYVDKSALPRYLKDLDAKALKE